MINVTDIAYVRYQAPDLDAMETFLLDFGLHRVARTDAALYMRAGGADPVVHITERGPAATLGFGFQAASDDDLVRLAAHLGVAVQDNAEPGGGRCVRFTDPSGFRVEVVHGRETAAPQPSRPSIGVNPFDRRARRGETVRLQPAPSNVRRLGHVAVLTAHFAETRAFYETVLGFKASDTYWVGAPDHEIAAFLHCGLGDQWTDHHTIALITAQDGRSRFDHSAFEVLDLDDLMQGHALLAQRGYPHAWGVGRHIQGSQIFDYWRDPFGHKIEHWTDGDLVNDSVPTQAAPLSPNELFQWGPTPTPAFFE
jgi:catechol 2,3-dioxygenase-like lactoylglutathione lyase family enzyme